jgi:hypothetical protein
MSINLVLIISFFLATTALSQTGQTGQSLKDLSSVSGTKVSLQPPSDFLPSNQFPGYSKEVAGSAIIVTEIPIPFSDLSKGFSNPEELSKRGMTLLERKEVSVNGQTALLFQIAQKAFDIDYLKWILVLGDEKESIMVAASFPKEFEKELSQPLKTSVLTTTWNKNKVVSITEGLSYSLTEKGDYKLAKRLTNALVYTVNGVFPSKSPDDPFFIIAPSIAKLTIEDKEAFSKSRALSVQNIEGAGIETIDRVTIDNLSGYEILARGKDKETGQVILIYQVTLFDGETYYIMQGLAGAQNGVSHIGTFKQIAGSFKRLK